MGNKTKSQLANLQYKGETYTNAKQIANLFNKYFTHAVEQTKRINRNKTKFEEIEQSHYMRECNAKNSHSNATEEKHPARF